MNIHYQKLYLNQTTSELVATAMILHEKVGIYDHPTTQYELFIERYYGRHKGSGKSKATVISKKQVSLFTV